MQSEIFNSEVIAVSVARVFLGLLFLFQGFDAVFRIGLKTVINTAAEPLVNKGVPKFLVIAGSFYTSYVQLIAGVLLIIGLFKYYALYLLGIDLLLVCVVFGLVTPMWDMRHVSAPSSFDFPFDCPGRVGRIVIRLLLVTHQFYKIVSSAITQHENDSCPYRFFCRS